MTALNELQINYWAEARLQRWGHVAIPLSSTRVAIHGGYGRDGKKLRRLDDVVIVSSDGTVAPAASSTPRPKARERHGAAAVDDAAGATVPSLLTMTTSSRRRSFLPSRP